ncbi:MAG TPA: CDP-diacylglycerol--serine O-phosphatidyltransferase [Bacteroidales bacterium]|nr:CDP-diacylglycerol--serine O-phosphatidyltransferase [Bacteroidales bacterium]
MNIKKHIPNAITSLNLVSGCIAIILTFNFDLKYAAYFILLAAVFDFFDGMAARWLHVKSAIGKELDSLADIVSFGVAPGLIVFQLCAVSNDIVLFAGEINLVPFIALLIPVFSALRLAKFNLDTRQTESFIGLPVPANALMIASLPLILNQIDQGVNQNDSLLGIVITSTWFLLGLTIVMSFLLVSGIRLFSLKFKNLNWNGNEYRLIFLIGSLLLFVFFQFIAIPIILLLYIVLSLFQDKRASRN